MSFFCLCIKVFHGFWSSQSLMSHYKDLHSENTSGWWWRERRAWKKENRPLVSPTFSWKRLPGWFTIFWWVWLIWISRWLMKSRGSCLKKNRQKHSNLKDLILGIGKDIPPYTSSSQAATERRRWKQFHKETTLSSAGANNVRPTFHPTAEWSQVQSLPTFVSFFTAADFSF